MTACGQQLALPAGTFSDRHLIRAAHGGDVTGQATITYTDGTVSQLSLNLTDWSAGAGRNGNTVAVAMDQRIKAGQGVGGTTGAAVRNHARARGESDRAINHAAQQRERGALRGHA